MNSKNIVEKTSPKILFLVDSLGVFLTALMLGLILTTFENVFGMSKRILYILSLIAFSYSIYSFACYLKIKTNWSPFLKGIAFANLLYCLLPIGLVIYMWSELTKIGLTYFFLEAITIFGLVVVELRKANMLSKQKASR
ncbi:hypothetical protein [Xanthovirga aplysinae]|uniref:hypothetical protein n=1 Tax=Xanthovirga aplysinae TaxID=2529853 RepID=UPI0012BB6B68|nr:hypothetical protein [Xanthovirga aplysinae]MTI30429.1 hypothetical protein [Xanthovirga aplysinae]